MLTISGCRDLNFENEIIKSLSSGDYRYIVENSESDVSEKFLMAYLRGKKEFQEDIFLVAAEGMDNNRYYVVLKEKCGRTINIQYKKEDGRKVIYYIEISVWPYPEDAIPDAF
jgi:hypothetical protein